MRLSPARTAAKDAPGAGRSPWTGTYYEGSGDLNLSIRSPLGCRCQQEFGNPEPSGRRFTATVFIPVYSGILVRILFVRAADPATRLFLRYFNAADAPPAAADLTRSGHE